jgi:hypothetical protein
MESKYQGVAVSCDSAVRDELLLYFLIASLVTALLLIHLLKSGRGQSHVGLVISYLLGGFWINHWFGVAAYLVPGYCGVYPELEVPGARETLYALLGFAAGVLFLPRIFGVRRSQGNVNPVPVPANLRNGFLALGVLFYVAAHVASKVNGLQAILASGQQLLVVAVLLNIWEAARKKQKQRVAFWLVASLAFPFLTVVQDGFLGYGINAVAPIYIFAATCIGRRNYFKLATVGFICFYLGLSLYVNYMRERTGIRADVWGGNKFSARVDRFSAVFQHFEWFSPFDPIHLDAVVGRMNQSWLVGAGVVYAENTQQWARGETLEYAALAFIPRFLWPNKPQAGGGDMATRYTGIPFAEGTAVSIGQVLELYVNYGSWLVFFGFVIFGGLAGYFDSAAREGLNTGAWNRFLTYFVIGSAMVQIMEPLAVTVAGAVAGVVLSCGLQMFLNMKSKRRRQPALQPMALRPHMRSVLPG